MKKSRSESLIKIAMILLLLASGMTALLMPELIYSLVLYAALIYSVLNGFRLIAKGLKTHRVRHFLFAFLAFVFAAVLLFSQVVPEWMIRVVFGLYCLLMGIGMLIQQGIYIYENVNRPFINWIFSCAYTVLGFLLLFTPRIGTSDLIRFFGCYFLLLSFRYFSDYFELTSRSYTWKRAFHISLPTFVAALIPDWTLQNINAHFQKGEDIAVYPAKGNERPLLKAMVHIGPEGFQKVGHFSFAWKDIVFSYGNYDQDSGRLGGLLGDGVYFNVPLDRYLPNILQYEHNTVFEYGIHVSEEQEKQLDEVIDALKHSSYRWYTRIEKEDGYSHFEQYESDYACRLHYRTGAKFYKIKSGRFRTYWFIGENCVMFSDLILGLVGADILSVKGVITPGTYYDYLQSEYEKENSPVISCTIHPYRPLGADDEKQSSEK